MVSRPTKSGPGDPVRAKIGRAEMHLRCLETLIDEFVGTNPYRLALKPVPQRELQPGFQLFVESADPVPEDIGLVAGDFLTNLRASLDYLAWELVKANGGTPNPGTSFPLKEQPPRKPKVLSVSGGVSPAALALIKAAQPYNTPEGGTVHEDRMWILSRLVGIDKHRHLLISAASLQARVIVISGSNLTALAMGEPRVLEADTAITMGWTGTRPIVPEEMDMDVDLTVGVILRKDEPGGGVAICPLFTRLLERVRDEIVPSFAGLR